MGRTHINSTTKQQIVKDYKAGVTVSVLSEKHNLGKSTVYKLVQYADKSKRKKRYSMEEIRAVLKQHRAGADIKVVCSKHGISISTLYLWIQKYKHLDLSTTAYNNQFKRNVINSLHDGHSKFEVSTKYGVALKLIDEFVDEFKNGELDNVKNALTTIAPKQSKPAIKDTSTDVLDDFCDVLKLLVGKGLDIDNATDTAKQLMVKFK